MRQSHHGGARAPASSSAWLGEEEPSVDRVIGRVRAREDVRRGGSRAEVEEADRPVVFGEQSTAEVVREVIHPRRGIGDESPRAHAVRLGARDLPHGRVPPEPSGEGVGVLDELGAGEPGCVSGYDRHRTVLVRGR